MPAAWSDFHGANLAHALDLYEQYRRDPESVDEATRALFDELGEPQSSTPGVELRPAERDRLPESKSRTIIGAVNYIRSIRRYGHLAADIDPLGTSPHGDPSLELSTHGISRSDLEALPASLISSPATKAGATLADLSDHLREIYCGTIGYDLSHIFVPEERRWLEDAIESQRFAGLKNPLALLDRLTDVEAFEVFLQRTFPGKTRFSIEGLDMLVPVLDEVVSQAGAAGVGHVFVGMAHRGRLNVLAHVFGKPYRDLLAEFGDSPHTDEAAEDNEFCGDVKYHVGAETSVTIDGHAVRLIMPPNPSHLEAINPVLEGMARAAGTSDKGEFNPDAALPVLIHGDAAFPGQGIVAETLNLHALAGYSTGGTIHVIANNQIGFTTDSDASYSTSYASGLARGFKIPIVHVNADDPEACVAVARLALAYRQRFKHDFLIDLIGYRRRGHNEGDEPSFTQPLMYERIAKHPTVRARWASTLEKRGAVAAGETDAGLKLRLDALQKERGAEATGGADTSACEDTDRGRLSSDRPDTGLRFDVLRGLSQQLFKTPAGFELNPKLSRARAKRASALDEPDRPSIDWSLAEEFALASILADGTSIRLTGEDVERGTFSQRHAVLVDARTGVRHIPLRTIAQPGTSFEIFNSPLSEAAAVGFEYGYTLEAPKTLVIWEAQYGDFINGAQTIVDEFVLSGRVKWNQSTGLVLLLPHGSEGQGPDHASARPERLLQLAADGNLRLANCTTAAQYFHLLRAQAKRLTSDPVPLIVLTPKSLLRNPAVNSRVADLARGRWQPVLDDPDRSSKSRDVRRLVLCSGKFGIDLLTNPSRSQTPATAICRVEQLCPLPTSEIVETIERYSSVEEVVWAQEEPENMGAWEFVRPHLQSLASGWRLLSLARPRSSSPAEGSASQHARAQARLIAQALGTEARTHAH